MEDVSNSREHIVLLIFSLTIIIPFFIGLCSFLKTRALFKRAIRTTAEITHAEIYRGFNASYRNCLNVTYKDQSGQSFAGIVTVANGKLKAGDQVEVLYDPKQASKVLSTEKELYYAASGCMFFIAVVFGIILAALVFNGRINI